MLIPLVISPVVKPVDGLKYYGATFVPIIKSGRGDCGWLRRGSKQRAQAEAS